MGFPVRLLPPCVLKPYSDPSNTPTTAIELFIGKEPEVNGVPMTEDRLMTELRQRTQIRPVKEVYILANDDVLYEAFVHMLDRIAPLHLDRVIVLTKSSGLDLSNSHCFFYFHR